MLQPDTCAPEVPREHLRNAVKATVGARFVEGNRLKVLKNGVEIFPEILEALAGATKTIEFLTFVYWQGDIARKVADTLAERAEAGVQVRVLLDAFGSMPMKESHIRKMKSAGATVEHFRPIARWKFWESDHRTHRKIIVVDNQIGFTGGMGVASEWEGDARSPDEWRDTHFRVDGPIVLDLKAAFLTDWRDTGHAIARSDTDIAEVEKCGDVEIAAVDGAVQIGYDDSERILEALIAAASRRVLIQTPYFNPSPSIMNLLTDAIERGVEVSLLLPGPHIDARVSAVIAEEMYLPLIEAGARVWIYQPTMMHTKAFLVDGVISMVGSTNVNRRSVMKDEEIALAILDEDVTSLLEAHFDEDVGNSLLAAPADARRPIGRRLMAKLLKPFRKEF